ncbi:hypothetical protein MJO28_001904 [Puccinia striiformis f. sp. tritici]|uniref:Uncharacterized protein n=1 Tax=Puccinia striiformis f. sp. tritici TaxID=168172 RepID=A0ACC0EVB8_9BASI|nr:hypothetical protein MJO28_001904 [Puccinia striiformis f. sp. tritici]
MNHSLTTTAIINNNNNSNSKPTQQQDGLNQINKPNLKNSQHRMIDNKLNRRNDLQIQQHTNKPTNTPAPTPNTHFPAQPPPEPSSVTTNQSRRRRSRTRTRRKTKQKPIDLESYPQESLLKLLADLFHRITAKNDHLNHHSGRRRPATPSSLLVGRSSSSRRRRIQQDYSKNEDLSHSDDDEQEDEDETDEDRTDDEPLDSRPSQSPTVIHFQQLNRHKNHHHHHHQANTRSSRTELTTASLELLSNPTSILTFHAKVVPQISIEAYLLRILKYCPTSNAVFLSTIIYLDRLCTFYHHQSRNLNPTSSSSTTTTLIDQTKFNKKHHTLQLNQNANDHLLSRGDSSNFNFVIDSWNVHRFLIASITASSKLLSDVFYTNSRYAKVGGLPLEELEELEIKFLLMSDFRLMISRSEFDEYTERLLAKQRSTSSSSSSSPSSSEDERKMAEAEPTRVEEEEDEDTDREDERIRGSSNRDNINRPTLPNTHESSASSVSSCNSSERSSCSTITPHSPNPSSSSRHHHSSHSDEPSASDDLIVPIVAPSTPRSTFLQTTTTATIDPSSSTSSSSSSSI